ncbi:sensor histidine kinase [Peribacillus sp. NPDC046944]|uniref:sensor histidine kinase n=1 Tax=unclassified Peribacillus TaxID=2675266 RepID=UPI003D00E7B2
MGWLVNLRIAMFLMISFMYYWRIPDSNPYVKGLLILIAIGFILNHYLLFYKDSIQHDLRIVYFDGILSFVYGFLFPQTTLYMILVGVVAITVFILVSESKKHRIFGLFFVFLWGLVMISTYLQTGTLDIMDNLMSFSFVAFTSVVGNLIRKLTEASDVVNEQYLQLNEAHEELSVAHKRLQEYSLQAEETAKIRERNRIAREIHDTVGHKMTALFVQMELAYELIDHDLEKAKGTMNICKDLAQGALEEVRYSVQALNEDETAFLTSVNRLLNEFHQSTGLKSTLELSGDSSLIPHTLQPTLIRVIQESLTNAKRHGNATVSSIRLVCIPEMVRVEIQDNGKGASLILPGFGLKTMQDRINEMGGVLSYRSKEAQGFHMTAEFPLNEKKWAIGGT